MNLPGTRTGVPSNSAHGFQSSFSNPKKLVARPTPTTSMPSASAKSGPTSPSIWNGSVILTGVPGGSRRRAWRSR